MKPPKTITPPSASIPNKTKSKVLHLTFSVFFVVICIASLGMNYYLFFIRKDIIDPVEQVKEYSDGMKEFRDQGHSLIKPLLMDDLDHESGQLEPLKRSIVNLIDNDKSTGKLTEVSVYLSKLSNGNYISINDDIEYRPGSIAKLPLMIYFLSLEQEKPGLLETNVSYNTPIGMAQHETYKESDMKLGQSYTIKDLISKMIVNSDNIATSLLLARVDNPARYQKLFIDLGIPPLDLKAEDYKIKSSQCSRFLRVLYNATYLNEKYSQFALELLSHSDFKEGIIRELPSTVIVAHKFGEAGGTKHPELSETSIIYQDNDDYVLTIMTKGTNSKIQAEAIGEISKLVYDQMKNGQP